MQQFGCLVSKLSECKKMNVDFKLPAYFLPILLSAGLIVASSFALVMESAPFKSNLASASERFFNLEQGLARSSLSVLGQRYLLNDCMEAISGPAGMAQPTARRMVMLNECQSLAMDIVADTPGFALAWYIGALASLELGQFDKFNFQLAAAQQTAPNEQWLARLRVELAEKNLEHLTLEVRAGNDADLRLLVQSRLGVASIASRYVAQSNFRERITAIVETLGEEEQRRFVSFVRAAANALIQRGINSQ